MKKSLNFSIAGICGRFIMDNAILHDNLRKIFTTYENKKKPMFKVFITGSCSDLNGSCSVLKDSLFPSYHLIGIESSHKEITIVEYINKNKHLLGYINSITNQCCIVPAHTLIFSKLLAIIRACYHYFLEKNNGFFLHASSGTLNGKTFAFTGKSDAGKTTALRNLKPDSIISEDVAAIRLHGNRPQIFATPFRQDKNAMGKAEAIFFPKKTTTKTRVLRKNLAQSISEITSHTLFSSLYDPERVDSVMDSIIKFCMIVPAFNLYFNKKNDLQNITELIA